MKITNSESILQFSIRIEYNMNLKKKVIYIKIYYTIKNPMQKD